MAHPGEDDLGLLALGESVPGAADHVDACPACRAEVEALRGTVATARAGGPGLLEPPPERVWERVSSELGLAPAVPPAVPAQRRPARARLLATAALALAAVVGVGVLGARLLSGPDATSDLVALGDARGSGRVVLHSDRSGTELEVETDGLPAPQGGFYEVWLLDPASTRMVALGVLDERGTARLAVPDGLALGDRPVVDISAEPDDGNPAHSLDSVLRGDLPA